MKPNKLLKQRYLRPDQAAWELDVSRRTVYRLIAAGELTAFAIRQGGSIRIPRESVVAFVKRRVEKYQFENGIVPADDK